MGDAKVFKESNDSFVKMLGEPWWGPDLLESRVQYDPVVRKVIFSGDQGCKKAG
jgi:hypothetical protein